MDYKALTIFFFVCSAALAGASSGTGPLEPATDVPGGDEPTGCDAAREVYRIAMGAEDAASDLVYQQPKDVKGASACGLSKTCCSGVAEQNLSTSAATDLQVRVADMWEQRTTSCNSSNFKEALTIFIEDNKLSLLQLLEIAYYGFFTRYTLFDEFYNYLKQAVWNLNTCKISLQFNKLFFEVFLAVLEADPGTDTSVYPEDDREFNLCMYNYYLEVTGEDTHSRFVALTRSFNRTLYYLRALNTAEEFLEMVVGLELTPQCRQALLRSSYCAQCGGHTPSTRPCLELCLNTIRGCLVDYSDLYEPYRQFTEAAIRMKRYLDRAVNPFTHIDQFTFGFLDVATSIMTKSRSIHQEILVRCLRTDRGRRETEAEEETERLYPRALFTRSTVAPPNDVFNNSAYCHLELTPLFRSIPDSVCEDMSESHSDCWNGDTIGRYGREVSDFSRDEQLDNPEVIVCPVLSGEVRVQLAHLRRVTQEMNVITRSEACPEDDEDCEVDELRCNFNIHRSVSMETAPPLVMTDDEDSRASGNGCGSDGGSGFGSGSGDCTPRGPEVNRCLVDPFVPTTVAPTSTIQVQATTTKPPVSSVVPPVSSVVPTPTKEPPIIIERPAAAASHLPSAVVILLSLLLSFAVLQSVL